MRKTSRSMAAIAIAGALLLSACGSEASSVEAGPDGRGSTLNIVGFAVPEAANKAIAAEWKKTDAGKDVGFETSYGASGDQSRAVVAGLPADYVHFSVSSDVSRLVAEGLVDEGWNDGPNKGVVSSSIVVFAVRKGNPLGIEDWDDLVESGIEIVTPNPGSSGAARWNALAAWGQVIEAGGTEAEATEYLEKFFGNVVALPNSGRDATQAFLGGTGNVLMAYENEAILARQNGEEFDYIIPETTLLIENPGAVLTDADPKAAEWLAFVLSADGQRQFGKLGFRPLVEIPDLGEVEGANDPANPYPVVKNLLTVAEDFESWSALSDKFFDESAGIVTKIIADSGKAQ